MNGANLPKGLEAKKMKKKANFQSHGTETRKTGSHFFETSIWTAVLVSFHTALTMLVK